MRGDEDQLDRITFQDTVVKAAAICLKDKGLENVTFDDVAEHAGMAVEDVKTAFGDMALLIYAVQMDKLDDMTNDYLATMPEASLEEKVLHLIRKRTYFAMENSEGSTHFYCKGLQGEQPWSDALDRTIWQLSVHLATLFAHGVRKGEVRSDLDVSVGVKTLVSIYLAGVVTIGLRARKFDIQAVLEFLEPQIRLFLAGLRPCMLPDQS